MSSLGMENTFYKKDEFIITGNITSKTRDDVISYLDTHNMRRLVLDTNGGDFRASVGIVNAIKMKGLKPEVVINNKAYSSGGFIFLNFKKRFISKQSILMIHDIALNSASPTVGLLEERKRFRRLLQRLVAINFKLTDIEADNLIRKGRMYYDEEIVNLLNARMLK